jgi:formylglycine-generating enzyme required for sulfatase activity
MSGQIFISYRREESSAWAGRLSDRLSNHFPSNQIFMDVDSVDLGEDFVKTIEKTVGSCDVLIAVIGKGWLISCDQEGQRRLDNPEDFVRIEIATALKRDIRVIPVLVDGASMPPSRDLPDDLKALVRRNALQLSHERFRTDSERLASAVERALEKTAAERREGEEKERLEAERRETEAKESVEAERRQQKEEQQQLEAAELERLDARRREHEEQERLEHEPQAQPPTAVAPPAPPAKPEADKPSAETPKVVYPLPGKPAEPEREKPPPPSSGGTGGKSPSKQVIAFLAIAAVLVVAGLIYLATRPSPPPQHAPIAAVTPSPPAIATPTVEEKALPKPEMAVQPSAQPTAPVAVAIPSPSISATPTKEELARRALDNATKDHPWVNSLGMKFVPVAGTQVLFSVWDTRVQDFETFVKNTDYDATGGMFSLGKDGWNQRGATWKKPGFSQGANHPVVGVSWNDAKEFCKWLTKREQSAGDLPEDREYRLPKDEEWSAAVGLKNEAGSTPEEKNGKIALYPWDIPQKRDKSWPPPSGAGNYRGEESRIGNEPKEWSVIEGYNDGYPRTSPVGSFHANFSGLHDMGGNVWQWCEDWYNAQAQYRVLRGASWNYLNPDSLLASSRYGLTPDIRYDFIGFRCVVAVESSR